MSIYSIVGLALMFVSLLILVMAIFRRDKEQMICAIKVIGIAVFIIAMGFTVK